MSAETQFCVSGEAVVTHKSPAWTANELIRSRNESTGTTSSIVKNGVKFRHSEFLPRTAIVFFWRAFDLSSVLFLAPPLPPPPAWQRTTASTPPPPLLEEHAEACLTATTTLTALTTTLLPVTIRQLVGVVVKASTDSVMTCSAGK